MLTEIELKWSYEMAGIDIITKARGEAEFAMIDLALLMRVCDSINPNDPPDWLALLWTRVNDLEDKFKSYMDAVHEHAIPHLRDLQKATGVKATASGGMGAVAPMAAKRSGAEASGVRTPDQPMGANANKGRIETGGGGLNGSNSRK